MRANSVPTNRPTFNHWRRLAAAAILGGGAVAAVPPGVALAQGQSQSANDARERQKWEAIVTFWGQEDTNVFDLRVPDRLIKEPVTVRYIELWKYDLEQKRWVKIDDRSKTTKIVMPADKPQNSPEDSQVITELPITFEQVGLYYAKWSANGLECATMTRLGPNVTSKESPGKPPPGFIVADVPESVNKAVRVFVPDPRENTGQPAKTKPRTQPGK